MRGAAGGREPVGGARGIRADQDMWGFGVIGVGPIRRWQRRQRLIEHADVVGGGIAAGIPLAQQPGQRFPAGDVGAV
jgi:hypothetical protein